MQSYPLCLIVFISDCICGEFIVCYSIPKCSRILMVFQLVIDKSLATLPRRKTDGAIIIRSQDSNDGKARVFKLNATTSEPVLLERFVFPKSSRPSHSTTQAYRYGGHERQFRFHCPRCTLPIGKPILPRLGVALTHE